MTEAAAHDGDGFAVSVVVVVVGMIAATVATAVAAAEIYKYDDIIHAKLMHSYYEYILQ